MKIGGLIRRTVRREKKKWLLDIIGHLNQSAMKILQRFGGGMERNSGCTSEQIILKREK